MSIKKNLIKRLEEFEKKLLPGEMVDFVFIQETDKPGIFSLSHTVSFGEGGTDKDYKETWEVKAENAEEVAERYNPPDGCKEVLKFIVIYD